MEREKLYRLLRLGIEKGASDIHLQVGYLPLYRFNGDLVDEHIVELVLANSGCLEPVIHGLH